MTLLARQNIDFVVIKSAQDLSTRKQVKSWEKTLQKANNMKVKLLIFKFLNLPVLDRK
jgi:hypothetical protein